MGQVAVLTRASAKAHPRVVSETADEIIARKIQRATSGAAALFDDANTTTLTIGGGGAYIGATVGKLGQTDTFLGSVTVDQNLVVSGNLTVSGTATTLNVDNLAVEDRLIIGASGIGTGDEAGIAFERGSTGDDAILLWNEVNDRFELGFFDTTGGTTIPSATLTNFADFKAGALTGTTSLGFFEFNNTLRHYRQTIAANNHAQDFTKYVTDTNSALADVIVIAARSTSGTGVAAGFGGSMAFRLETASDELLQDAAAIDWIWTNATNNNTAECDIVIRTRIPGSTSREEALRVDASAKALVIHGNMTGGAQVSSPQNARSEINTLEENLVLSTVGTTTDTTIQLPADALILAVTARITTTIATATDWKVGDATTADRFIDAQTTLTAGTTRVGIRQWRGSVTTDATGPTQTTAAAIRVTTTGTPSAGAIRLTIHFIRLGAATS